MFHNPLIPVNPGMNSVLPEVVKSIFVESGTYQPMELRTYETQFHAGAVEKFNIATNGGVNIGKNALATVAADIITPSTAPSASLSIDEGWGTRRFTFVVEIRMPDTSLDSAGTSVVLTGYTNYTDVSMSGQFDPNMRLYFNSSNIVSELTTRLANGQITKRRVLKDSSHLLGSSVIQNINPYAQPNAMAQATGFPPPVMANGGSQVYWMTPKSVVDEMGNQQHQQSMYGSSTVLDYRRVSNPLDVIRSRRDNTVTSSYLSGILSSVSNESGKALGTTDDELVALSEAAYSLQEMSNYSDPVITRLITMSDFMVTGYVTWGQMCHIFPGLNERTLYTERKSAVLTSNVPTPDANTTEHWRGLNFETQIANSISQLVPALMTSCLIGNLSFTFTNDNPTASPEIQIFNGNALIDGVVLSSLTNRFIHRFNNEVVPVITNQGRSIVTLLVHSNIGAETQINVSYENGPAIPFCAPTFCDAMYSPIITPFEFTLSNISSDLYTLASMVSNNQMVQPQSWRT